MRRVFRPMNQPIPYLDLAAQMRPIRREIDAAIARALDHCTFCLGPDVAQFERDFARYCGAEHAVGFNSGTSALHVALRLLDIGPGEVFGEISVLLGEPPTADVVAAGSLRCLHLPGPELEPFLTSHPNVTFRMLQAEARRLHTTLGWRS